MSTEKHFVQKYQDGEIDESEFNRLNVLQIIESEGYKIMCPESVEYLKGLLAPPAPEPAKAPAARELVAEMHSFLATDLVMGENLKPTDLDWMAKAKAYLEGKT